MSFRTADSRQQTAGGRRTRIATMLVCCLLSAVCCLAKNGAYKSTAHGDPDKGPQRRNDVPRGSCLQCHDQHLFASKDDNLCFVCHAATPQSAAHAQAKCGDCHDPHGVRDRDGVIPSMLAEREPRLCINCHDGSRGADIRSQLSRSYTHGAWNRQAVCSDCHGVHQFIQDPAPSSADRSSRLAGVSRVQVVNGGAGVVPAYRLAAASDPGEAKEHEVCFRCHSSWAKQPLGQSDLARLTNPANPSFHPIQAAGRNTRIDPRSFVNGFAADSLITCSDCHDPHGSSYRYLLKKSQDDLCFECHAREVYADATSAEPATRASRWNGHVLHAAIHKVACFACHETHGSVRNAALIATGRFPGISSYIQTAAGGTCTSNCHGMQSYMASYGR